LEGRLHPEFSLEIEIALYSDFILQLECELAYSKEKERDLSERWSRPKGCCAPAAGEEAEGFPSAGISRVERVARRESSTNQMLSSRENALDFSRSRLEEVQCENDRLRNQVHRLEWEIEQQR